MWQVVWFAGWAMASTVLITPIPQEPVIFYGATHWHPLIVAAGMTAASCISAVIDYRVLTSVIGALRAPLSNFRGLRRAASWFVAAPFPALVAANLLPIPLSPFKLICIANRYPLSRFQLALVLGRFPRYLLLASVGRALDLSLTQLLLLALVLVGLSFWHRRRSQPAQLEPLHG